MAHCEKEASDSRPKEKIRLNSSESQATFLHKLAGYVGAGYLHFVGATSFTEKWDHPSYLQYRRELKPMIHTFWHNVQVFLAYAHRNEGVNVMVSQSKDGEYIAQVMKRLGLNPVRGSTSRAGVRALLEMCQLLEKGKQGGFTPDGPRGPVQTVHGGVITASQRSGAPIVPNTAAAKPKIVFRSWDKFRVPLPFSTVVMAHAKPLYLSPEMPMEQAQGKVREALNANTETAEQVLREAPAWGINFMGALLEIFYTTLVAIVMPVSLPFLMLTYGPGRTFRFMAERFNAPDTARSGKKRFWLHAASIGEWQALRPVLAELKKQSELEFVITVSTPEARELIAKEEPTATVRMLPVDLPWVISRWIKRVSPWAVAVVETEIWPNMIKCLNKRNIPVFVINGRLSKRSAMLWAPFKPFIRRSLRRFSHLFVRTDLDGSRFCRLGAPATRVTITGNTKYDNLPLGEESQRAALRKKMFGDDSGVWVIAGSTSAGEEASLLKLFEQKTEKRLRLLIAPRHKSRFAEVAKLLESVPASWSSYSKIKQTHDWETDILLVDTLGDLKNLYALADVAFVGGSLVYRGGQNPLEPAAGGVPVLFGPSMENFHEEAAALKRVGAARQSRHENDVLSDIRELVADENMRRMMGTAARRFVQEKQGAAMRTVRELKELLGL